MIVENAGGHEDCLQVVDRGIAIHTREFADAMKTDRAHQALVDGAKMIAYQIAKVFKDPERRSEMLKRMHI